MDQAPPGLVGRGPEFARLLRFLDDATSAGTAVLIEGTAGIGKTALLTAVREATRTRGFRELHARGVQAGGGAGFVGLHEMLHPVLDRLTALPARQRSALTVAFGQEEGPPADRLLVGLATLGLLEETAAVVPLLVVIEDLHWLDRSSADVVSFLARRLGHARVLLLASTRTGGSYEDRGGSFPVVLPVEPLVDRLAAQLLRDVAPDLAPGLRARVLTAAAGNPLALHELSAELRRRPAAGAGATDQLPMTERLEQAFLAEMADLTGPARAALLLAAAGEDAAPTELAAAGQQLGLDGDALGEVERAGFLRVGRVRVTFRHPLVASAIYGASSSLQRAETHRALAAASPDRARAVRHRAAATLGWDAGLADDLEGLATAAVQQGANPEAMTAYRRAAALSPVLVDRVRRLTEAAEAARRGGLTAESEETLREALPLAPAGELVLGLARTEWLLSMTAVVPSRSAAQLVELAGEYTGPSRVEILLWAATKAWVLQEPPEVRRLVRAGLDAVDAHERDGLHDIAVTLLDPTRGPASLRADLPALAPRVLALNAVIMNVLAFVAEETQDEATAYECWTLAMDHHHAYGRISDEAVAQCGRGTLRVMAGLLADGLADAEQALRLSLDFGLPVAGSLAAATIAQARAMRGEVTEARSALAQYRELAGAQPFARVEAMAAWAAGLIATVEGRSVEAWEAMAAVSVNEAIALWASADLIEAAVRAQRPEAAEQPLAALAVAAAAFPASPRLHMLWQRSVALTAAKAEAGVAFAAAVRHGEQAGVPLELGRTHLMYGEWLRRERRILEAREHLTTAVELLTEAEARPWAVRAATELDAAGAGTVVRADRADPRRTLTPQELQVARLASTGLSNKEIADQIYLSHRTVATHLHNLFPKLGITQRSQLAGAMRALTNV
ncbi:LuxR family transcriptional regulator [Actinoplanes sp. M2I2]|uniref:helix-turn-helix transcriptional regulator n=1 Tax=Actinoplanes sp. M2I2 TaxID=1734444 RepID=UPI0020200037|nr:LuxR family transcriptional regulator [Actinoplanes sp. M2I2]